MSQDLFNYSLIVSSTFLFVIGTISIVSSCVSKHNNYIINLETAVGRLQKDQKKMIEKIEVLYLI